MKRNIKFWQAISFISVCLLGTFLHFLFDITKSPLAALFSGVNESTWEHMKLLFFPMLIFSVIEYFIIGKEYENFWCVKATGTYLGLILIPVLFYTLNGIFGQTSDWLNISIFFISAAVSFIYETCQFKKGNAPCKLSKVYFISLSALAVLFWVFTFYPPEIPLFQDPIDGGYGL